MAPRTLTLLPLLGALPYTSAWGSLGHTTVAYIAQNFVNSKTAAYVQNVLGDTSSTYMASVATWADSYRYTSAGHFSAPYHFLDALDNPPSSCNVDYERDCTQNGCIVSAISNYSAQALQSGSSDEQVMAMKWVIHFVGDIHQPLHVENLDLGGNKISVSFGSEQTNLHAAWDTSIPQKKAGTFTQAHAKAWAATLTTAIKSGTYSSQAASWLQGIDVTNAVNTTMIWAAESNSYVCSTVMPQGVDSVSGQDLSGSYYTSVIPVVELQIARAGYRLAAWLDAMVASTEAENADYATGQLAVRGDYEYDARQLAAKKARQDIGSDCGCGAAAHVHD